MSCLMTKLTKLHVRPAKTQVSLGIRPVWSESSLCAQWVAKDPSFPSCGQRRLWSDWADARADLSLHWAHMPFCWFCHAVVQILFAWCNIMCYPAKCSIIKSATFVNCFEGIKRATTWQNQQNDLCAQWRLRSAWASAQSDQSLRWVLNGWLRTQAFFMWTAKTLIRLGRCPGWSESSLDVQIVCWFCLAVAQMCFFSGMSETVVSLSD